MSEVALPIRAIVAYDSSPGFVAAAHQQSTGAPHLKSHAERAMVCAACYVRRCSVDSLRLIERAWTEHGSRSNNLQCRVAQVVQANRAIYEMIQTGNSLPP